MTQRNTTDHATPARALPATDASRAGGIALVSTVLVTLVLVLITQGGAG